MLDNCFYQLDNLPLLSREFVNEGIGGNFRSPLPEIDNVRTSRTIKAETTFTNSTFIQDLKQKLSPNIHACFFRNDPYSLYDWHTDVAGNRKCVINYLLTANTGSMTLFREPVSRLNYKIVECPYALYKPMLLNVEREHCVVNNSAEYRYLLSVSLPDVTFDQSVEFFKSYRFFEE
jgi:hypothetical protein